MGQIHIFSVIYSIFLYLILRNLVKKIAIVLIQNKVFSLVDGMGLTFEVGLTFKMGLTFKALLSKWGLLSREGLTIERAYYRAFTVTYWSFSQKSNCYFDKVFLEKVTVTYR